MKKSVKEFESLLRVRRELQQLKRQYQIPPDIKWLMDAFRATQDSDTEGSIIIMERVMTRISDSNCKIVEEELKAVEVQIAAYNDAFNKA